MKGLASQRHRSWNRDKLCALAALAYWGFHSGRGWLTKLGLGLGAPLLAALVWGTFVAPKASIPTSQGEGVRPETKR